MPFEQTRFTIVVNAAGTGTARIWNYIPSPDAAEDDFEEPGYFGSMEGHIHAGDLLWVATPQAVELMAFGIGQDGIEARAMCAASMPETNMQPMPQELPGGSQPATGPSADPETLTPETVPADDKAKEEKSKELAQGESEPETVQPPPKASKKG